jgi:hypothetical protein
MSNLHSSDTPPPDYQGTDSEVEDCNMVANLAVERIKRLEQLMMDLTMKGEKKQQP